MSNKKSLIAACVSTILIGGTASAQQANEAASAAPESRLQTVVVTGSSIKRQVVDSSLPVQILTTEDIRREGITSPEQLISYLNSNGNGLDNLASNADVVSGQARGNNGASSANLRGQGSAATLILLNGRRVAAHGLNGGAVDINQIPLSAIERVEILKDGASAIYGTDAIGGVINFILKNNFQGLNFNAFGDVTELGGGAIYRGSITGGLGDVNSDGWNIMATVSFSDHRELRVCRHARHTGCDHRADGRQRHRPQHAARHHHERHGCEPCAVPARQHDHPRLGRHQPAGPAGRRRVQPGGWHAAL
jgi:iron complex outermembrane receptor protein